MPSDTPDLAAKLDALIEGATKGPWTVEDPMGPDSLWVVQAGKPTHEWFPIAVVNMPDEEDHLFTGREAKANVRIAALAPLLAAGAKAQERVRELEADIAAKDAALAWYGEQARLARLIHNEGDAGRHALAEDGGKRARAALAKKEHKDG